MELTDTVNDINEYFRSETNRRLEAIEKKIDRLLAFKWEVVGGAGVVGVVLSLAITFLVEWVKK